MSRILINQISDAPTQRAFRALEEALDDVESRLEARVDDIEAGETAVTSVTAGSSAVSVTPTTGDVVVDVVEENFSGIPQSAVTNLVTDLTDIQNDITIIQTDLAGKIDEVIAGTNLSGGGASGSVTLDVVDSPTFAGDVVVQGSSGVRVSTASGTPPMFSWRQGALQTWDLQQQAGNHSLQLVNSGVTTVAQFTSGGMTVTGLAATGNVTLGNATTDQHALNGTLNANSTTGSNGQILQVTGGLPQWGAPSTASIPTGTGTADTVTKWTGANTLGNSNITDDGTTVTLPNAAFGSAVGRPLFRVSGSGTYLHMDGEGLIAGTDNVGNLGISSFRWNSLAIGTGGIVDDGDLTVNGNVTVNHQGGGGVTIATAAATQPQLILSQTGQASWIVYEPASTDDLRFWNSSTGDVLQLATTGATVTSSFAVNGNATLGNASGDAHSLTGTLSANSTAGSNGQVLQVISGLPQWGAPSSASIPTGTGTANLIAKWTGTNTLGNSSISDTGTNVSITATGGITDIYNSTNVSRGTWSEGALRIRGTTHNSHFNYGTDEHTYIRGGKAASKVVLNDGAGGDVEAHGAFHALSSLQVDGSATLGNASADTHFLNGRISATAPTTGSSAVIEVSRAATGVTNDQRTLQLGNTSSYDSTAAERLTSGAIITSDATRSAGANDVVNRALFLRASGGQRNYALWIQGGEIYLENSDITHLVGDISLNETSGTTTIGGATTVDDTLTVTGNTTLGDATSDVHTVNGTLSVNGPATSDVVSITGAPGTQTQDTSVKVLGVVGDATVNQTTIDGATTRYGVHSAITLDGVNTFGFVRAYAGYFDADVSGVSGSNNTAYALYTDGGDVHMQGDVTMGATLDVSGAAEVDSLQVVGTAAIGSTLDVTGATSLASTLDVEGAVTVGPGSSGIAPITGTVLTLENSASDVLLSLLSSTNLKRIAFGNGSSGQDGYIDYDGVSRGMRFRTAGVNRLTISSSGTATFENALAVTGATTLNSTLAVSGAAALNGNVAIGNASGDAHTLTGTLNANSTAGANGEILQIVGGVPQWASLSTANGIAGSGTTNALAKFTSSTTIGDSLVSESGTTVTVGGLLSVTGNATISGSSTLGNAASDATTVTGTFGTTYTGATTSETDAASVSRDGSCDVTAVSRETVALRVENTTAVTGNVSNALTNVALHLNASGADNNQALVTSNGNCDFNVDSGSSEFHGSLHLSVSPTIGSGGAQGRIKIGHQVFTASGTYTPTTGTKAVRLREVGAGGGGGGVSGVASNCAAGAGGAAGEYLEVWIDPGSDITGGSVTIGAAGSAGTSGGGSGGTGGNTSAVISGTTYTANGGAGGTGMTAGSSVNFSSAGVCSSGGSTADIRFVGAGGLRGLRFSAAAANPGDGASGPFGSGGAGRFFNTGQAADGYGAGGAGAHTTNATSRAGGAGSPGVVIIEEYA